MSLATLYSRALTGAQAAAVTVEAHVSAGPPRINVVGLSNGDAEGAIARVRAAIASSGFSFPSGRVAVNIAPADMPKEGGRYDFPAALGILAASGQLPAVMLGRYEFSGGLAPGGELRSVGGALPAVLAAMHAGRGAIMPPGDAVTGALARDAHVLSARTLLQACAYLSGREHLPAAAPADPPAVPDPPCISDIKGQAAAKRALEVAAAGGHSVLVTGPRRCGKSMLAERLCGLMPPLTEDEALESASARSMPGGDFRPGLWRLRPLRSPRHTASATALVGDGRRLGEISLSHHGVLLMDELAAFARPALEALRAALELGAAPAARARGFPAAFQMAATMSGHPRKENSHSSHEASAGGAGFFDDLLECIDMHIAMDPPSPDGHSTGLVAETSAQVCARVSAARKIQRARQNGELNAGLSPAGVGAYCTPDESAKKEARRAMDRLGLSARGYHRLLKVARTIADLKESEEIHAEHIGEAIQYRRFAVA